MGFGDSLRAAEGWKGIVAMSSVVPRRPSRLRDLDEMNDIVQLFFSFDRACRKSRDCTVHNEF